jgi:ankyrin repeat protein
MKLFSISTICLMLCIFARSIVAEEAGATKLRSSEVAETKDTEHKPLAEIIQACEDGDTAKVLDLLAGNPDLANFQDENGLTPLIMASLQGHQEVLDRLLAHGAHVDMPEYDGWTPLMFAAHSVNIFLLFIKC